MDEQKTAAPPAAIETLKKPNAEWRELLPPDYSYVVGGRKLSFLVFSGSQQNQRRSERVVVEFEGQGRGENHRALELGTVGFEPVRAKAAFVRVGAEEALRGDRRERDLLCGQTVRERALRQPDGREIIRRNSGLDDGRKLRPFRRVGCPGRAGVIVWSGRLTSAAGRADEHDGGGQGEKDRPPEHAAQYSQRQIAGCSSWPILAAAALPQSQSPLAIHAICRAVSGFR